MCSQPLRRGDRVQVRSAAEILKTLDDDGELDALPFMPEMVKLIGHQLTVDCRAESVCDTVNNWGTSRRMIDTVLLDDPRCDGSGHGGCQAECRPYWKEAWLQRVSADAPAPRVEEDDGALELLTARVARNATRVSDDGQVTYRCQATQALVASVEFKARDPRSYTRQYSSGNVSALELARVMGHAVVLKSTKQLGRLKIPALVGPSSSSPKTPLLGLQPGDWVRVKPAEEIAATLNDKGKNRGLWFDREMLPFCGKTFRVRQIISRLLDERTGEMIYLSSDCVTLDGAVCSGVESLGRWFCPRAIYPYWREGWLERVDTPA